MIDKWSFDPRTGELTVWDSNDGREGHYQRFGSDGYSVCAQGTFMDGLALKYDDRPYVTPDHPVAPDLGVKDEPEKVQEAAKAALVRQGYDISTWW